MTHFAATSGNLECFRTTLGEFGQIRCNFDTSRAKSGNSWRFRLILPRVRPNFVRLRLAFRANSASCVANAKSGQICQLAAVSRIRTEIGRTRSSIGRNRLNLAGFARAWSASLVFGCCRNRPRSGRTCANSAGPKSPEIVRHRSKLVQHVGPSVNTSTSLAFGRKRAKWSTLADLAPNQVELAQCRPTSP